LDGAKWGHIPNKSPGGRGGIRPARDNPASVDVAGRMDVIRELCSFKGRLAGTDAERRAANWLAARLRAGERRVDVQPTYIHPQYGLVHAFHCSVGFAGSLVAVALPPVGFALVLLAAISMYLDLNYRLYLARSLFFRRASQNVLSVGRRPEAPARVILCAHYDAARTGAVFAPSVAARGARLAARLPVPIGPFRLLFWALVLLLPILGARMAGLDSALISALQVPSTLVLLLGALALVDIELSGIVPGANDNASGVATVLSLAEELDAEPPPHLDVWVLLTGAEECLQEGMRAFVLAHRGELDPETTHFVCLDTVGHGRPRFEASAGWVVSYSLDARLNELCEAIAEADAGGEERYGAAPLRHGFAGDSLPPRLRGYPSIGITSLGEDGYVPGQHTTADTPERVDPAALERAHGFTLELIRQLDRDVARRARVDRPPAPSPRAPVV
jgi:Peptidase family M28